MSKSVTLIDKEVDKWLVPNALCKDLHKQDCRECFFKLYNAMVVAVRKGKPFSMVDYVLACSKYILDSRLMRRKMKEHENREWTQLFEKFLDESTVGRIPTVASNPVALTMKHSNYIKEAALCIIIEMYANHHMAIRDDPVGIGNS